MADNRNFVNKFANQGGGDIFVEDAKLSEISTKTAIASEGVMLKGTDGAYYEIDKASLSEVIRAELGAILADNSKNNGTSVGKVPTLNSSGNALGASSVADLASVLGVDLKESSSVAEGQEALEQMPSSVGFVFVSEGFYNGYCALWLLHNGELKVIYEENNATLSATNASARAYCIGQRKNDNVSYIKIKNNYTGPVEIKYKFLNIL